jgi:hypothetical protein
VKYSEEQLTKIKEYAGLLLTPDQICLLLELDLSSFKLDIKRINSDAYKAYQTGKTEIILSIRKQEIQLAQLGSPMAVDLFNKFALEQKLAEK